MAFALDPLWPPTNTQFSEFSPRELHEHIQAHGVPVLWEQATECACLSAGDYTVSPRANCPVCGGRRFEYHSATETVAIVTPLDRDAKLMGKLGSWAVGKATITMHADQLLGERDRVSLLAGRMRVTEFVRRGAVAVDALDHPIVPQTFVDADGGAVTRGVLHLRATNSTTGQADPERVEGVDFAVTEDGRIDWTLGVGLGTAPAEGQRYVVNFYARPRYVVVSIPHVVRAARRKQGLAERITDYLPTESIGALDTIAGQGFTE